MSFNAPHGKRSAVLLSLAAIGLAMASTSGCLNPTFVNQLTGGSVVPLAPGDIPFVHLLIINATAESTVSFQFGWTPSWDGVNTARIAGISPKVQHGLLLPCPVNQVGLGNPSNLTTPAVIVTTGDTVVNIPAAAFPLVLRSGEDFSCGDTLVFTVTDDPNNGYGIQISTGKIDGSTQGGPFTGPDTYAILQMLLQANNGTASMSTVQ